MFFEETLACVYRAIHLKPMHYCRHHKNYVSAWVSIAGALQLKSYNFRQECAVSRWRLADRLQGNLNMLNTCLSTDAFYSDSLQKSSYLLMALNKDLWHNKNFSSTYYYMNNGSKCHLSHAQLAKVLYTNARISRFESRKERMLSYIMPIVNICLLPIRVPVALTKDLINIVVRLPLTAICKAMDFYDFLNQPTAAQSKGMFAIALHQKQKNYYESRARQRSLDFEVMTDSILSYIIPVVNICLLPMQVPAVLIKDLVYIAVDLPLTVVRKAADLYDWCICTDYTDSNQHVNTTTEDGNAKNNGVKKPTTRSDAAPMSTRFKMVKPANPLKGLRELRQGVITLGPREEFEEFTPAKPSI